MVLPSQNACGEFAHEEGSAAWAVALKSGRRPLRPQAVRALAGGLRLVTEGYRGKPPPAADPGGGHLIVTSDPPEPL